MTMPTTRRAVVRRRLALVAIAPLLTLTAACGGDSAGDWGGDSAEQSSGEDSSTSDEGSADAEIYDEETLLPALRAAFEEEPSSRVQMSMSGGMQMSIDGRMAMGEDSGESEMEMSMELQGQQLDMRLVDGLIYISGAPMTQKGKWIEIDPSDAQDPMAQQFAGLVESGDLTSTFDAFEAGLQEVEHVGAEEIDGEPVQHYVLTVDAAVASEAQGMQMQPGMPEQLDYDLYLTEDDLMRRVEFDLGGVAAVIDATEWGEEVDVEAPAESDIVKMPGMAG
jgi:hypothetical protein